MRQTLYRYLQTLVSRTIAILKELLPLVILAMLLVRIGEQFGLSQGLATLLAPLMEFVGLPAVTGIVWAVTLLTGIYGGIGAYLSILPGLELSVAQHSILCSLMLFAHALPVEQSIVHKVGAGAWSTGLARIVAAVCYGAVVNLICKSTGFLSQPLESPVAGLFDRNPGWTQWIIDTTSYVLIVAVILVALLVLMDLLKTSGAIGVFNRLLRPLLSVVGVDKQLAPVATTGLLLGVVYGGALLLEEVRSNNYPAKSVYLAMMLVCLLHALIEDTLVVMAIGANVWIVLIGRVPFALLFVAILTRCLRGDPSDAAIE